MIRFNRILICLDYTKTDKTIFQYTSYIINKLTPKEIYFIHVLPPIAPPYSLYSEYTSMLTYDIQEKKKNFIQYIKKNFKNTNINFKNIILLGSPLNEILKFAKDTNIDLIIIGKKKSNGLVLSDKLARKSSCSILFLPQNSKAIIKNILIPLDFSSHSKRALETAVFFANRIKIVKIFAQHIVYIPHFPDKVNFSKSHFKGKVKEKITKDFKNFIKNFENRKIKIKLHFDFDDFQNIYPQILKYASDIKTDMIVMGSKGKTFTAAMFLGSVAENVVKQNKKIPLLIIKKKNENLGFMKLAFKK